MGKSNWGDREEGLPKGLHRNRAAGLKWSRNIFPSLSETVQIISSQDGNKDRRPLPLNSCLLEPGASTAVS